MPVTKEELQNKLAQIHEQAQLTLDELPLRLAKDRLRLIIGLSKYLQTAVDMSPLIDPPESGAAERQPRSAS